MNSFADIRFHFVAGATLTIVAALLLGVVTANTNPPNSICAGRRGGFFVRDVRQCNAFFRCQDNGGAPVFGFCQTAGSFFNERLQRCVWPQDAECFECPAGAALTNVEVRDVCNHYVRCIDGQAQQLECGQGLSFDAVRGTCNFINQVRCGAPPAGMWCPAVDEPNNRLWWRDLDDCSVYAACVNGRPVRRACAHGLHFDTRTLQCEQPHLANCPTESRPFRCEDQEPLPLPVFPHPTDCSRFYNCVGNVAHPEQCPSNTLFDTVQQRCDSADRAVCAPGAHRAARWEQIGGLANVTRLANE